jgi:hypothetical protein
MGMGMGAERDSMHRNEKGRRECVRLQYKRGEGEDEDGNVRRRVKLNAVPDGWDAADEKGTSDV